MNLYNGYDGRDMHRLLVGDEVRTRAFRDSIRATVRPEDVVLDVGAGSGILSLFAAQAGARRVYAVERARGAADLARRVIAANGLSAVVQVLEADAERIFLPEKVDVIVSEWLGVYGVDENMLAPVLVARDRWLKPEGSMIPSSVTAWIAPVCHDAGKEATAFLTELYGLDLSSLAPFSPHEVVWLPNGIDEKNLLAEPQPLWVTNCQTMVAAEARKPYAADLTFRLAGSGANGVITWFSAEMPGADNLCNGPGQPLTHWGVFFFPIANAQHLAAGEQINVGFHNVPGGPFGSHHLWSSQIPGQDREVHDTRRNSLANRVPPWRAFIGS